MASQDLINAINFRLAKGEDKKKIKEFLLAEGWQELAIDAAFKELEPPTPSFWQQTRLYPYFTALDEKTAHLPARVIWAISGLLIVIVCTIFFIIYLTLNPFVTQGSSRDQERDIVYSQLKIALQRYHDQKNSYPGSLTELVPDFIKFVPLDPKTHRNYDYMSLEDGSGYNLCIYFETKSASEGCINTEVINAQRLGIPTPTKEPNQ